MKRITVWRKEYTNKEGKKFPVYRCKDAKGNFYNVKTTEECKEELPNKKIFIVVADDNKVSYKLNVTKENKGKVYTENFAYLHKINAIEEFVQDDCDIDFV